MLILFVFCAVEHVLWSGYVELQYSPSTVNRNTHMQFNTSITAHYPSVAEFISLPSLDRKKSHSDLKSVFFMHARKYRSSGTFIHGAIDWDICVCASVLRMDENCFIIPALHSGRKSSASKDWLNTKSHFIIHGKTFASADVVVNSYCEKSPLSRRRTDDMSKSCKTTVRLSI